MAASSRRLPLAVLLFLVLVLVVASAVPATATGGEYSGARMVIIRGAAAGAQSNKWRQQHYRRRRLVEDEVAPELGGLLGAAGIGYGPLDKDAPGCPPSDKASCAAKDPGQPYTRDCTYKDRCTH